VSIAGPATRFSKGKAERLKDTIIDVCNKIFSELGFRNRIQESGFRKELAYAFNLLYSGF